MEAAADAPLTAHDLEIVTLLYERNAKVLEVFWEWRHKLLTFGTTSISILIATAGFLEKADSALSPVIGIAGFALGLLLVIADLRNGQILKHAFGTIQKLEKELLRGRPGAADGVFSGFPLKGKVLRYGSVVRSLAAVLGLISLMVGFGPDTLG
jgi:hypothetical protein